MATYKELNLAPVHGINRYLWQRIKDEGVMDPDRYKNNWIPIIPTQQIPDFTEMVDQGDMDGGVPFIIYNWTTLGIGTEWWATVDQVTYTIYSQDEGELRRISNFIVEEMKKWDETAQTVNDWLWHNANKYAGLFDYKGISVIHAGGPLPLDEEGGRQETLVALRVAYTVNR